MSEKKKAGRPKGSKSKTAPKPRGKAKNIYFKEPCLQRLERLLGRGLHGNNDSAVICAALKNLEENPPPGISTPLPPQDTEK